MISRHVLAVVATLATAMCTVYAQVPSYAPLEAVVGLDPGAVCWSPRGIGDLDGDGITELLCRGGGQVSAVYVLNGADRKPLARFLPPSGGGWRSGYFGNGYDLFAQGSGSPLVLIGDPESVNGGLGVVYVADPIQNKVLATVPRPPGVFEFGWCVKTGPDVTGDGIKDFAVVARNGNGAISLMDGSSLQEVWRFTGAYREGIEGNLDWLTDLDGDGVPELLAGSPIFNYQGRVLILSGATGQFLWQELGTGYFGTWVHSIGDLTGDGVAEFAVLSRKAVVTVFDGVRLVPRSQTDLSGWLYAVMDAGLCQDKDSDGVQDLVLFSVSPDGFGRYHKVIVSSRSGTILWRDSGPNYISSFRDVGDITGDGQSDLMFTEHDANGPVVQVWQGTALSVARGSTPSRSPTKALALELTCPSSPGGMFVMLYSWTAEQGTPLGRRRLPLDPTPLLAESVIHPYLGHFDAQGQAAAPVPAVPGLSVPSLHACFVGLDPAYPLGVRAISNAVDVTLQ